MFKSKYGEYGLSNRIDRLHPHPEMVERLVKAVKGMNEDPTAYKSPVSAYEHPE